MKKILSTLLITVGSLGILAGIAGAVYAFNRNGSKIKDSITGTTTSSKTNSSKEESTQGSASSQSSASSQASQSSIPDETPYNDPSAPAGVTVEIEPFEYYQEHGISSVAVPIDVYTAGWDENSEMSLTYDVVGYLGQAVMGATLQKQGEVTVLSGSSGNLPGGGHYTLTLPQSAYDEFYVYQFKVTLGSGGNTHVGQAKFALNGAVSDYPYLGDDLSSGLKLLKVDGDTTLHCTQPDSLTANTVSYYVVSPFNNSTKRVKVQVVGYETGDQVTMSTDEFGTSTSELTVPVGTRIDFTFPVKADGECDRYTAKLNFVGEGDIYTQQIRNYGVSLTSNVFDHPDVTEFVYDEDAGGVEFDCRIFMKINDDKEAYTNLAKLDFDSTLKPVIDATMSHGNKSETITQSTPSYAKYIQLDFIMSDQNIHVRLGYIDPGMTGVVTLKVQGMTWSFNYTRAAAVEPGE